MQYTTQDLSPVKKKITVTVPAEECDAALSATVAMYRSSVTLDGFRKGKAPADIIEKLYRQKIYDEATTELVNVHINDIVTTNNLQPVSRIDYTGGSLTRGTEFVYTITFEVMPSFELPNYEGHEVEQEEPESVEEEINGVIERLRFNMAEIVPVDEVRSPADNDIVIIDFEAENELGEPIDGIKAENFQLTLGQGQTLPDFETLIKTLKPGETDKGMVAFPSDFFNPAFAGRTVAMSVRLHAIKTRKLPELDDAFAQKAGGHENVEKLQDSVRRSYLNGLESLTRAAAQKRLLDSLLAQVDFPIPEAILEDHINVIVNEMQARLERQGKTLLSLGKSLEAVREEVTPEAMTRARSQIFLLTVARTRNLTVTEREVDTMIRTIAMQSGQEYTALKERYSRNNMLFALRDKILADKAMDEIYAKADVKRVRSQITDLDGPETAEDGEENEAGE